MHDPGTPGYSLLFTHPVDRADSPFTTLTGLVDRERSRGRLVVPPKREQETAELVIRDGTGRPLFDRVLKPRVRFV